MDSRGRRKRWESHQHWTVAVVAASLRAIIQQLTEAIASGREVGLEMGVGTLRSSQRVVSFSFSADLYASEGLQVPPDAAEQSRPAKTFTPPSKDALSLTVDSNQFRGTVKATDLGGFHDSGTPAFTLGSSSGSGMSKEELAQREARDRHLADISEEAEEAVQHRACLWMPMSSADGGKPAPKSTKHAKTPLFPPCSQLAYSRFLDKLGDQRRAPEWTFNRSASGGRKLAVFEALVAE
ncbi:hypothetical protein AK812_SmicGene29931 [Symbiodinium microadriaticum]|uniref:CCDC81 HU domain-containing protein n=1 Tax=Symbiodinium microadriaticum TaxID=2951 RepID=A0A1Q9D0J0_SYMMI|nr:hypothetical protein AK812_SmicGene29931 [Symbiodinium microadriaticum]